ncbi:MAG: DUF1015 domain-containing protein [Clostridia bacterium]|nr:DUF1015 domain-containing protein [Clostridia bacterium]
MANIKAFKGYRYNSEKINNIGTVVSPPYYNISDKEKAELYDLSEYNSIRLFSGKELEDDTEQNNRFTRAANYLHDWIEKDILKRDEKLAIYMYEQTMQVYDVQYSNRTFVALLELEEFNETRIMPCEEVREVSLQDRYDFLTATNADLSMITCLYVEREKDLLNLMNELSEEKPDVEFESSDNVHQRLWAITYQPTIDFITEHFKNMPLYITDGQTRYETCLKYRNYMKANNPDHDGTEPYNYTMVALANSNSDGLVVLPVHREVKCKRFREDYFVAGIQDHFKIEKIIVDADGYDLVETMKKQIATTKQEIRIAAYCGGNYFYRLTLTDKDYIKNNILPEMSKAYCGIDIVVLNKLIIDDILHVGEDEYEERVHATRSHSSCLRNVQAGEYDIMFIMNPIKTEQIKNVTAAGEKMPKNTLSVFPKPSVGVIINVKED